MRFALKVLYQQNQCLHHSKLKTIYLTEYLVMCRQKSNDENQRIE